MEADRPILLVEDNPNDEVLTLRALKRHNLRNPIAVVRDGSEALAWLGLTRAREPRPEPQVILLDLKLPKIDGLDVLRAIRADPRTKRLPVVVLTSSKDDRERIVGYELGANSFVNKPVEFDQFMEAVKQIGLYWLLWNAPAPGVQRGG